MSEFHYAFIIIGYAIPAFLFAILLIVFFAGGSYFDQIGRASCRERV